MPRYFFDINDSYNTCAEEGLEFTDLQAAIQHSKRALYQVVINEVRKFGESRAQTILIRTEDGRHVYSGTMTYTVA